MIGNTNVPLGSVAKSDTPDVLPSNGVYIRDTNGKYWTVDAWDGSTTPTCIAVITDDCAFGIALVDAYSTYCQWGGYGTTVSNIVTTTDSTTAKTDYAGESNTTAILNQLGNNASSAPAAYYCMAFTFPNGQKGYLGAAGEWQAALDNKAAITTALSKVGGAALATYYWTSTQYSSGLSWCMNWGFEYLGISGKNDDYYVRAFCTLDGKGNDESEPDDGGTTNPSNGVYIQSVEGKFYTESEWDGTKTPNGIAVITDNCSFIMALNDLSTSMAIYNDYFTYPNLPQVSSTTSAIIDYDGIGNTAKMTAVYGTDSTYAAGACTNFTFPNGKNGYLGAVGEWNAVINNKSAINTALSKVGGTQLPTSGYHRTSTRAENDSDGWCKFWYYLWDYSYFGSGYVKSTLMVRAFTSL